MHIILPIIGFFLLGFAAKRFIPEPTAIVKWINYFIIYVSLPSIILMKVPQLEFSSQIIIPVVVAWAWLVVGTILVLLLSRWLGWSKPTEGALLLLVTMCNSSFLGYPMVLAFFDDTVLGYAIFFDQLGGFLILSTYGFIVVVIYAAQNDDYLNSKTNSKTKGSEPSELKSTAKISLFSIIKGIIIFPPIISLVVALTLPVGDLVSLAKPAMELIAILLMPLALFVLGVQFQPALLPEHKQPLMIGIGLKLLVAPLAAGVLVYLLNGSVDVRNASIFESGMPSMITPGLMAIAAGIAPRFVATMLGYCTLASFITLPILAFYLNS